MGPGTKRPIASVEGS